MFKLAFLLGVVALGPQVVQGSFKFTFSPVVQCAPVSVSFSGSDSHNHSVPTTLTILPLVNNAVPIQIPIPNGASNSTGIELSFIPLPAGTTFVATLDDVDGPASKVSDVTKVLGANSTDGSADCLTSPTVNTVAFFEVPQIVSQCDVFLVHFTTSDAPNITAFKPTGGVTNLPLVSAGDGVASYMMTGQRGDEVALLFNDTTTNQVQTSALMTIDGDSGSSTSCLNNNKNNGNVKSDNDSSPNATTKRAGLPKAAIIGIAAGAAVLVFAAMVLLWYFLRQRRRRRRTSSLRFDPALLNRRWPPADENEKRVDLTQTWYSNADAKSNADLLERPASGSNASFSAGVVRDPLYTNDKWRASVMTDDGSVRTSFLSWNQPLPEDQQQEQASSSELGNRRNSASSESRLSMNTVDIQNILQMATVHRDSSTAPSAYTKRTPQPSTAGTTMSTFEIAKPAVARLLSARRPAPADLPQGVSPVSPSVATIKGVNGASDEGGYAIGTAFDGVEDYPMPSFQRSNSQRDTSESWGNVIVR
ncbi:hypothetical protein C8F01DRAFT_518389 [Mycena amicta]|nr:hypothetical protein C8F01DRAFT_518389 [Mycena amicta]